MVNRVAIRVGASLVVAMATACKPAEEGRPSLLDSARVLAVQASPAEVTPGQATTLQVLRAGPDGQRGAGGVALDFCVARKPIAAPGIVAEECLAMAPSKALVPIEPAEPTAATIPPEACALFGPKPASSSNDVALRPADPDTTGGYYQPIRAVDDAQISFFSARISCGITGVNQETSIEYTRRHRANENPSIQKLLLGRSDGTIESLASDAPALLRPGEDVQLAVVWASCPRDEVRCGDGVCGLDETAAECPADCAQPSGCTGAETYVLLDPLTRQLRLQRENIRVSWFITAGELDLDKSGRSSDETAHDAQNHFRAPTQVGDYWLFAAIRDDRGGVGWNIQPIRVD